MQNNLQNKIISYNGRRIPEFFELSLYVLIAVFLVYFIPVTINRLVFLALLPVVWFSKRDYFWIVFFFILLERPSGLFSGGLKDDPYRLPIYTLGPGISFALYELYILVIFFKTLFLKRFRNNSSKPFFQKELKILLLLYVILILISPLMGMGVNSLSNVIKLSLSLTLFYSLFRLINSEEELIRFIKVIFPFAFIALFLQIYYLINGEDIVALVKPGMREIYDELETNTAQSWIRPIEMGHAMLITFTATLWLLLKRHSEFRKPYLILINMTSFLVIFLTGTRSWIVAFSIGYLIFFIIAGRKISGILIRSVLSIIAFIIILNTIPVLNKQIKNSWSRVITVEKILEGDITAGGTASRFDIRAPRVMEGFLSSSILLGAGFSNLFYNYADGHVGYHNILLNAGFAGFAIFVFVILKVLRYPFRLTSRYKGINKRFIRISIISLVILLIINTGTQTIGFTPDGVNRIVLMVYSLIIIDQASKINLTEVRKESRKLGQV